MMNGKAMAVAGGILAISVSFWAGIGITFYYGIRAACQIIN